MRFYLIQGFVLWLVATIILRLVGQWFFVNPVAVVLVFGITGVGLFLGLGRVFNRQGLNQTSRMQAVLALALPGMALDILTITFASRVFPNIPSSVHTIFAGWLLWAYSAALLVGLLPVSPATPQKARNTIGSS